MRLPTYSSTQRWTRTRHSEILKWVFRRGPKFWTKVMTKVSKPLIMQQNQEECRYELSYHKVSIQPSVALNISVHTCGCHTFPRPCMSTVTKLKDIWWLEGLWWDLPWRKGKWFLCNAAEGTLSERVFSKHSLNLLEKVPVIRFSFYFCRIAHSVTAPGLLSLKQNSEAGDSHSGRSGNRLLISLKCTHTPCRQLSLLGNCRDVIRGVLSDSGLIL